MWNDELNEGTASGFLSEAEILRLVFFYFMDLDIILFMKENPLAKTMGEALNIFWPVAKEIFSESSNSFLFKELIVIRGFILITWYFSDAFRTPRI